MSREEFLTKRLAERSTDLQLLTATVRDYISEHDNPVPDYTYRRVLLRKLRQMVGAPPEPPPRKR